MSLLAAVRAESAAWKRVCCSRVACDGWSEWSGGSRTWAWSAALGAGRRDAQTPHGWTCSKRTLARPQFVSGQDRIPAVCCVIPFCDIRKIKVFLLQLT